MSTDDKTARFARLKSTMGRMQEAHDSRRSSQDELHRKQHAAHAKRRGKRPLDVESIAAAGVAIADAQGVEEVSMRKIAAVLGSGTMSLYHYVRTKEDLLAAMDDLVMGEILVPPHELKGGWRKAMRAIAQQTRMAHRRHPWTLTLQSGGGRPGINGLRHVEQSLAALADTALDFDVRMAVILTVDNYVFGHSLRSLEPKAAEEATGIEEVVSFLQEHVTAEAFPELTAAMGDDTPADFIGKMMTAFNPDEWFDMGLEAIFDGIERRFNIK